MKILHVCESVIGGPASYFEEMLPFQVARFSGENVILLGPEDHRAHVRADIGCVFETYRRAGRDPRSLLALAAAIRRAVARHDPDIVHLHSSFAGAIGRLVVRAMRHRARIVYCAHCWSFDRVPYTAAARLWTAIERMLARATDAIVNLSPHENPLLLEAGFPARKIRLVVTGVRDIPPERRPALAARAPGRPLRLLFLGRFDAQKGADLLMRDFTGIAPERAVLTLVGGKVVDGVDFEIPPGMTHLGWVARSTLPELLAGFDAVIMPSRWEGMSIWAIEILRSGRPLLGSNRGVFPHIIDGVNGAVIDIDRPGFMDRAIRVLEASDLSLMGAAARATYERLFDPARMNRELIEIYESLLERPRPVAEGRAAISGTRA